MTPTDIAAARKAAEEARARNERAAPFFKVNDVPDLAALVLRMADEIERLRTPEPSAGEDTIAADDMMAIRVAPARDLRDRRRVVVRVIQEDDGQSMAAYLDLGGAALLCERVTLAMQEAAK